MRIISSFRDYYDSIMRYGMDLDLKYVRESKEDKFKLKIWPKYTPSILEKCDTFIIGFCGQIYLTYNLPGKKEKSKDFYGNECVEHDWHYCYNIDHVKKSMHDFLNKNQYELFCNEKRPKSFYSPNTVGYWNEIFRDFEEKKVHYLKIFEQHKVPIFAIDIFKQKITYNCKLSNFDFFKVKDHYTAFQEIRMWLSNQASPEPVMKKMTNEENAARLGHGDKYSFRTPPKKCSN